MNNSSKSKRKRRGSDSKSPDVDPTMVTTPVPQKSNTVPVVEGCLVCGKDNDHPCLLICELCNAEYHTYCLNPPLRGVPEGDWFCGKFLVVHIGKDIRLFRRVYSYRQTSHSETKINASH